VSSLNLASNGNATVTVDSDSTVFIDSNIFQATIEKGGLGTLVLTGDNQFTGALIVTQGILNIQRSSALGSPQGGTTVREGASLQLQQSSFGPVQVGLEALGLNGTGFNDAGVLQNISGNN